MDNYKVYLTFITYSQIIMMYLIIKDKAKPRYRPSVIPIMSLRDKYQLTTTRSSNYMKPSIIRNSFPKAKNGY